MKPHEEEWVHVSRHVDERVGHTARAACVNDDDVPRFISAAPEMARALLEIHAAISSRRLDPDGAMEVITLVLAKAGVPLP